MSVSVVYAMSTNLSKYYINLKNHNLTQIETMYIKDHLQK